MDKACLHEAGIPKVWAQTTNKQTNPVCQNAKHVTWGETGTRVHTSFHTSLHTHGDLCTEEG